jgi:hypothetical protein
MSLTREQQLKRLEEGQALPVATVEGLNLKLPEGVTEEEVNEYLSAYRLPDGKCWLCEGSLMVTWHPIVHGESECLTCGIGSRSKHYIKRDDVKVFSFEFTLQYHPKNFGVEENEDEA